MQRNQLSSYDLMVISKFFETIEDFINLEIATPKAKGNMSKFHYNPIELDDWSRQFFTSLQTLHIYSRSDNTFKNEQFFKRIIWYEMDSEEWVWKRKDGEIYKNVVMTEESYKKFGFVPEGVTRLGFIQNHCYQQNTNTIVIPNSVTSISQGFLEQMIQCHRNKPSSLILPRHFEVVGNTICNKLSPLFHLITIPSCIKKINGKEVNFEDVQEFIIPSYVTRLVRGCFRGCQYTKITIPTSIKELPDQCFNGCKQLKEITIPTSVTELGEWCFENCQSLSTLRIPTSVVKIGEACFYETESLKEIEIPSSVPSIGGRICYNCTSLTSVTLHDNCNEVKFQSFCHCTSLSSIVLPSSVTKIGDYAFQYCSSLTSINLQNVTNFGWCCFHESGITKENYPHLPDNCFGRYN